MATIKKFEEIVAWQAARRLAAVVYGLCKKGPLAKDPGMRNQIQRAAVSVGSNIAEGFERSGNKEFSQFLWVAKGSSGEVASQLYTILDAGYITEEEFSAAYNSARKCSYLIYQLLQAIKKSPVRGERYK